MNEVMLDWRSIFNNWADYCSIKMEKLVLWDPRRLKLLHEIQPFASF